RHRRATAVRVQRREPYRATLLRGGAVARVVRRHAPRRAVERVDDRRPPRSPCPALPLGVDDRVHRTREPVRTTGRARVDWPLAPHMLPRETHVGRVSLQVADLERSRQFYEGVLGLRPVTEWLEDGHRMARLGAADGGETWLVE